jgi:hypothetical protein
MGFIDVDQLNASISSTDKTRYAEYLRSIGKRNYDEAARRQDI